MKMIYNGSDQCYREYRNIILSLYESKHDKVNVDIITYGMTLNSFQLGLTNPSFITEFGRLIKVMNNYCNTRILVGVPKILGEDEVYNREDPESEERVEGYRIPLRIFQKRWDFYASIAARYNMEIHPIYEKHYKHVIIDNLVCFNGSLNFGSEGRWGQSMTMSTDQIDIISERDLFDKLWNYTNLNPLDRDGKILVSN